MLSNELAMYFERLRFERGFSQESFDYGIVSISQYKRYLKGHGSMSLKTIVELSNRLGLKYDYILDEFDLARNTERKVVNKLMRLIVNYDYDSFDKLIKELDPEFIMEDENKNFYHYTIIMKDLFQNKVTNEHALYQLKNLIEYPKILKTKKRLSVSEFTILGEIATLLPRSEQDPVFVKLKEILKNPSQVISGNNEKLIIMLLVRMIKILGMNNDFSNALFYCEVGINLCKSIRSFYSLDYLYYYASLCHHHLNNLAKRDEFIYLTIVAASIDSNPKKREKFVKLLEEDYHINVHEFMNNYSV